MTTKTLVLTVGLPRSGKSTWSRRSGYPVVCPDQIRLALHGQKFAGLAEPFVWAITRVMVRALFGAGHDVVVLDSTMTTRARRDEWKSRDWYTRFLHVPTSEEECMRRGSSGGRHRDPGRHPTDGRWV